MRAKPGQRHMLSAELLRGSVECRKSSPITALQALDTAEFSRSTTIWTQAVMVLQSASWPLPISGRRGGQRPPFPRRRVSEVVTTHGASVREGRSDQTAPFTRVAFRPTYATGTPQSHSSVVVQETSVASASRSRHFTSMRTVMNSRWELPIAP